MTSAVPAVVGRSIMRRTRGGSSPLCSARIRSLTTASAWVRALVVADVFEPGRRVVALDPDRRVLEVARQRPVARAVAAADAAGARPWRRGIPATSSSRMTYSIMIAIGPLRGLRSSAEMRFLPAVERVEVEQRLLRATASTQADARRRRASRRPQRAAPCSAPCARRRRPRPSCRAPCRRRSPSGRATAPGRPPSAASTAAR